MFVDGIKYKFYSYKNEAELEEMVIQHCKEIFGKETVYFTKRKMKSIANQGSIPDGFVIDFEKGKWYIIEIELSSHSTRHIVGQMVDFMNGIDNPRTQKRIYTSIHEEIINIGYKEKAGINHYCKKDIPTFLSELIYDVSPTIVIIIDEKTIEIKESVYRANSNVAIREFKTFVREGTENIYAHLFESLNPEKVISSKKGKKAKAKKREKTRGEIYRIAILGTLMEMEGSGEIKNILKQVENKIKDILRPKDHDTDKAGIEKWRHAAHSERAKMVKEGLLKKGSHFGIWEITEKGENYYSNK